MTTQVDTTTRSRNARNMTAASDGAYDPTTRKAAITAGLLFLTATGTFLLGDSLVLGYFSTPTTGRSSLTSGVALQAVCALANAGIGLALLGVLSRHGKGLARGYLLVRCLEAVTILAIGVYILATTSLVANYEVIIYGFTGTAGLMLSYVLLRGRLVPTWLSWLGLVGYVAILLAIPSTLLNIATLDSGPGMLLYVPGALFELLLPILLITRGFRRTSRHAPTVRSTVLTA
ncbi:DUF4386 domain-containing protein [Geodermatophilus obscurus]|uniref:DUF4386 domain-containing protein n=1 Tax=Geodermatophilus obscurus (strain ATCC 25078 / DSM 43160 / JCM 3152 / CCUG 61914 / KCC A-0152 / KCTC 9177 / NBRC 13315 / NRRL B-3577 / G-20) TaxID=526225 RepID=D2SF01_GEOOG|nr:DUF4386 domain-containing protein [Geodermatophilus obscurus]ADB74691.1 hypothetical protein Gobs_1998 [Geodermatophilus obscurus DSM 43160]